MVLSVGNFGLDLLRIADAFRNYGGPFGDARLSKLEIAISQQRQ